MVPPLPGMVSVTGKPVIGVVTAPGRVTVLVSPPGPRMVLVVASSVHSSSSGEVGVVACGPLEVMVDVTLL